MGLLGKSSKIAGCMAEGVNKSTVNKNKQLPLLQDNSRYI